MGTPATPGVFQSAVLEQVFARCFLVSERTRLVGGAAEPLYLPAPGPEALHTLFYRDDYFASALHEAAHWCIAGAERRCKRDFGYWYAPEGRDPEQQRRFEAVEVGPQALEWLFAKACAYPFRVSLDNLDPVTGCLPDARAFTRAVAAEAERRRQQGLPPRAARFFRALAEQFGTGAQLSRLRFAPDEALP